MYAVLVSKSVYSFVELSVSPVFRRQWSSIYEAIEDGLPPRKELMQLYIVQLPQTGQLVLAGDHNLKDFRHLRGDSEVVPEVWAAVYQLNQASPSTTKRQMASRRGGAHH